MFYTNHGSIRNILDVCHVNITLFMVNCHHNLQGVSSKRPMAKRSIRKMEKIIKPINSSFSAARLSLIIFK